MADLCSRLGFTGAALNACRNLEQNVLTPAGLYALVERIGTQSPQLLAGVSQLIRDKIVNIMTSTMISTQLPWFIAFVIILVVLAVTHVITPLVAILLGVLMLVLAFIIYSILVSSIKRNVDSLVSDVRDQVARNWAANRNAVVA